MSNNIKIRKIEIKRFRGLEDLTWNPGQGMNIILGGGDCGKTTILESIGLLFSPSNSMTLSDADFWQRKSNEGFSIVATISVTEGFDFTSGNKTYWPWEWDGENAVLPLEEANEPPETQNPVFKVSISVTEEFELVWEIIQPNDERDHFSVGLRRKIGIVKLSGDDKNDRDLRLVYGSALDRLLSDNSLRSKMGQAISQFPLASQLSEDAKAALEVLDTKLKENQLPAGLDLGIAGSQGISVGALISLFATKDGIKLPLTNWGAGTRRMSALQIASTNTENDEITLIDEIERGLEPYRLRQFIKSLLSGSRQSFVTTHSPIAIACSEESQLWFLDPKGSIGKLDKEAISTQQQRDPETFLAKLPVIVEGETEQGFVLNILEKLLGTDPINFGVRVSLGQGDDQMLPVLEALSNAGITFAGFADNDGKSVGRWGAVSEMMGANLFRWDNGCIETNVISVLPGDYLPELFKDGEGDWDGYRLRTVADRLGLETKDFKDIQNAVEAQGLDLKAVIIAAATGNSSGVDDRSTKKSWKKHAQNWFKKADGSGGRELVFHLVKSDKWSEIEPIVRPFFNSLLPLVGIGQVEEIAL